MNIIQEHIALFQDKAFLSELHFECVCLNQRTRLRDRLKQQCISYSTNGWKTIEGTVFRDPSTELYYRLCFLWLAVRKKQRLKLESRIKNI